MTSEDCGGSSDFSWGVGWPYSYSGYELIAIEYRGTWYPYAFIANETSSEVYWYRVTDTYTYYEYEFYYFTIGDYSFR